MAKPAKASTATFISLLRFYTAEKSFLSDAQLQKLAASPNPVNPFDVEESRYKDAILEFAASRAFQSTLAAQGPLDWRAIRAEARALLTRLQKNGQTDPKKKKIDLRISSVNSASMKGEGGFPED